MCELFMCIKLETKCMLEDTQSCGTYIKNVCALL